MLRVVLFRGGYRVHSDQGESIVPVPVVERLFLMMEEENRRVADVCKAVDLPRKLVNAIHRDLLREQKRMVRRLCSPPSGVVSSDLIGNAYGSNVGPNNDYLLPREGSEEAQRIDAERSQVLAGIAG